MPFKDFFIVVHFVVKALPKAMSELTTILICKVRSRSVQRVTSLSKFVQLPKRSPQQIKRLFSSGLSGRKILTDFSYQLLLALYKPRPYYSLDLTTVVLSPWSCYFLFLG